MLGDTDELEVTERLVVPGRLGERPPEAAGRGGMFVSGGMFDKTSIPTDDKQRVLRVPIPPDLSGAPCYDRDLLWPEARVALRAAHDQKIRDNLIARAELLDLCENDADARRDVEILCARDPAFWIQHFVWVIDPREGQKATKDPFVLYETQEQAARFFVEDFLEADSILWLVQKSRAWGATWLFAAALTVWGFLYRENWSVLIGAPNQDDVDRGGAESDHNSIFGKIRFLLRNLPPWQVPEGLLVGNKFNKNFVIRHPTKDNAIHGRQFCSNWGRGLRYLYTVSDEAAHSRHYHDASVNFDNTANRNLVLSTHKGGATEFAQQVNNARDNPAPDLVLHTRWWGENPYLTVDDYWGWRRRQGWAKVAQERDIDLFGSVGGAIFPDFDVNVNVVTARKEVRGADGEIIVEAREALDYKPNLPLGVLVDPGMGDAFAILWIQPDAEEKTLNIVDFTHYTEKDAQFHAPFLLGYVPDLTLDKRPWRELYEYDADELAMIERHRQWRALDEWCCFGDAYGQGKNTRVATGRTIYEVWTEWGIPLVRPVKVDNKEEYVAKAQASIGRLRIAGRLLTQRTQSRSNPTIVECFKGYAWVQRESPQGLPLARVPRHDLFSHAMDAYQFWFRYNDPIDPSLTPLAPPDLRDMRRKGKVAYLRAPSMLMDVREQEYRGGADDPICGES